MFIEETEVGRGVRCQRAGEQAAENLSRKGRGVVAGGEISWELRLQAPSACSIVPSDFPYKTQAQR